MKITSRFDHGSISTHDLEGTAGADEAVLKADKPEGAGFFIDGPHYLLDQNKDPSTLGGYFGLPKLDKNGTLMGAMFYPFPR